MKKKIEEPKLIVDQGKNWLIIKEIQEVDKSIKQAKEKLTTSKSGEVKEVLELLNRAMEKHESLIKRIQTEGPTK